MATVTGFTAERMLIIENSTVVDGDVVGDNLILKTRDGTEIDAGSVRGEKGDTGPIGVPVAPGIISMFGGDVAPAGYLLCDGTAVSRTVYPELFAAISTSWGPGDGTSSFNLPLIQDRIPVAKGSAAWANALAKTGGSKDLVVVSHAHDIGHSHSVAQHQHSADHNHAASSDWQSSDHQHAGSTGSNYVPGYARSPISSDRIAGIASSYNDRSLQVFNNQGGSQDAGIQLRSLGELTFYGTDHTHGNQGWVTHNHTHPIAVNTVYFSTGWAGAQTLSHVGNTPPVPGAVAGTDKNLPPYVVVNFIIKT